MKIKFSLVLMGLALLISGCSKDPLLTDAGIFSDTRDNRVYKSVKIDERSHSGGFNEIGYYAEFWTSLEFDALSVWIRIFSAQNRKSV